MALDAWLPIGLRLPWGASIRNVLFDGPGWQIAATDDGRVVLATPELAQRWTTSGLLAPGVLPQMQFGGRHIHALSSGADQLLAPVEGSSGPSNREDALAFAAALKGTRDVDSASPLHDAIYVERYSRLVPTWSVTPRLEDDLVLGLWLAGGVNVSVRADRRLRQLLAWLRPSDIDNILATAGMAVVGEVAPASDETRGRQSGSDRLEGAVGLHSGQSFELPGRPALAAFFNEHVIDVVRHEARYRALGLGFPGAVVLHGPPGSGKTFAVEQLVEFLGWPSFRIEASSVASPFIHETSKKIAETFEAAMKAAPSVVIVDEMEAFLADRQIGSGHHRVEEVAEFLRRIPEATSNRVLIVGMTNRLEMIDAAILRRGRFDHVIAVDYASREEISALLDKLLAAVPTDGLIDSEELARTLSRRPLSDVAFVIREAGRLAARSGQDRLNNQNVLAALGLLPPRQDEPDAGRRIGFK